MYRQPSHAGLASLVAAQGRGNDSTLVHMTPDEVNNLRQLARSMGTEMPTNPYTGLPEAGWLDSFLSVLSSGARAVGNAVISNPQLTGTVVGATYGLLKGDLRKGLEAGVKAYAGSSLLGGIASAARGAQQRSQEGVGGVRIPSAVEGDLFKTASSETDRMLPTVQPTVQQPNIFNQIGTGIGNILNPRAVQQPQQPQQGGIAAQGQQINPIAQLLLNYGLNRLEQKYGGPSEAKVPPPPPLKYTNMVYSRGRVNPRFPEPGQPYWIEGGYEDRNNPAPTTTTNQPTPSLPYQPPNQPYGMAMGGMVPSDEGVIPAPNYSYPMANIKSAGYSVASQRPRSAELLGGYDTAVDPFTGEETKSQSNFADGGAVQSEEEKLQNYFSNLRPFAPALSNQYRDVALNTGLGSLQGVPVDTADGLKPYAPKLADWYKSLLAPPGPPRDRIDLSEYFKTSGFRGPTGYNPLNLGKFSTSCPEGQTRNATTGQCEPITTPPTQCPDGEINLAGVCICPPGTTRSQATGKCETTTGGGCTGGKVKDSSGNCVCPQGSTADASGNCVGDGGGGCTGGKVKNSSGNCVCPEGSTADASGNCVGGTGEDRCPDGSIKDRATGRSAATGLCCDGSRPNPTTGKCGTGGLCPDGSQPDANGNCGGGNKTCPDGSQPDANGNCGGGNKTCPDGSQPDANGNCGGGNKTCPDGSKPDANGNCAGENKTCPDGLPPDPITGCYRLSVKTCPDGQVVPAEQPCCKKDIEKYDPATGKCVDIGPEDFKTCPEGTEHAGERVPKTFDCGKPVGPVDQCPPGTVTDEALKAAGIPFPLYCRPSGSCPEGQERDPSDPTKCRDIQKPNECTGGKVKNSKGDCVCPEGTKDDGSGNCARQDSKIECPAGYTYDEDKAMLGMPFPCTYIGYKRCENGERIPYDQDCPEERAVDPGSDAPDGLSPAKSRFKKCDGDRWVLKSQSCDQETGPAGGGGGPSGCPQGYKYDSTLENLPGVNPCVPDDGCPEGQELDPTDGECKERGTGTTGREGSGRETGGGGIGSGGYGGGGAGNYGQGKGSPPAATQGGVEVEYQPGKYTKIVAAGGQIKSRRKYAIGGIAGLDSGAVNPADGYNFGFARGGMAAMPEYKAGGKLLRGPGDGMSDDIPAVIRGKTVQRAALADGEFVVPADVVSHLGNGSTDAGAKKLYKMMEQIRRARTGKAKQAPRVNTDKFLPRV